MKHYGAFFTKRCGKEQEKHWYFHCSHMPFLEVQKALKPTRKISPLRGKSSRTIQTCHWHPCDWLTSYARGFIWVRTTRIPRQPLSFPVWATAVNCERLTSPVTGAPREWLRATGVPCPVWGMDSCFWWWILAFEAWSLNFEVWVLRLPIGSICLPFAYHLLTICLPFAYHLLTNCLSFAYHLLTTCL